MYYKKPVISSNCTSIQKIVTENHCGLIFMDRNSVDLSEKIRFLYKNPEKGNELGENGFNAIMKKFNWKMTSKPLLDLYTKLESVKN